MKDEIKKFFADHPALKVSAIEKEAGANNLHKFLKGERGFPESRISDLVEVLKRYGFKQ
jgi:hypothetical protein